MKILLIGAEGRMGKAVISIAQNHTLIKMTRCHDISLYISPCDVVLDFSTPSAVQKNLPKIVSAKKPWVIGVTGLPEECFKEAAKTLPIFLSPNFSYGISLLKKLLPNLPKGSYEIIDRHHINKKDSPSGTALDLAKRLPTPPKITSYREGNTVGEHKIILNLPYEKLEFSHEVLDRNVFAQGALMACSFLVHKPPGLYTSIYD